MIVCGDPRSVALTEFYFGLDPPPNDPRGGRVKQIEALGLPPLVWHPDFRLYDAGDGARLWASSGSR